MASWSIIRPGLTRKAPHSHPTFPDLFVALLPHSGVVSKLACSGSGPNFRLADYNAVDHIHNVFATVHHGFDQVIDLLDGELVSG